jgi:hypothetical protein
MPSGSGAGACGPRHFAAFLDLSVLSAPAIASLAVTCAASLQLICQQQPPTNHPSQKWGEDPSEEHRLE